jgi:hypothetical protein
MPFCIFLLGQYPRIQHLRPQDIRRDPDQQIIKPFHSVTAEVPVHKDRIFIIVLQFLRGGGIRSISAMRHHERRNVFCHVGCGAGARHNIYIAVRAQPEG